MRLQAGCVLETSGESNILNDEGTVHLRISLSDAAVRGTLTDWLLSTGDVAVTEEVGQPGPGEQGVLSELLMAGGMSAVVTAIRVLPDFIRAQKTSITVHFKSKDGEQTVDLQAEDSPKRISSLVGEMITALKKRADD